MGNIQSHKDSLRFVITSYSNRLGVLRKALASGFGKKEKEIKELFARKFLRNFYSKVYHDNVFEGDLANRLHDEYLKLLNFYFSECELPDGSYDNLKFEEEVKRQLCHDN